MTSSRFGEVTDVLSPRNLTLAALQAAQYKILVLAGDVEVDLLLDVAVVDAFVKEGGVVIVFAEQVLASTKLRALLAPIKIAATPTAVRVSDAPAVEDKPHCAPIFAPPGTVWQSLFYIKTGGDRNKRKGWDSGVLDKCCLDAAAPKNSTQCLTFASLSACTAALAQPQRCAPCARAHGSTLACPAWSDGATVRAHGCSGAAQVLTALNCTTGKAVPAVVSVGVGRGRVIVMLVNELQSLQRYSLLERTLQPLVDGASPFELLHANGSDARPTVQMMLNVDGAGSRFNVTLINNKGVIKDPKSAPVVDASAAVSVRLRAKFGRTMLAAWSLRGARLELPVARNEVLVSVGAGDVVVLMVSLKM